MWKPDKESIRGNGRGLAMLREETRRYQQELEQIRRTRASRTRGNCESPRLQHLEPPTKPSDILACRGGEALSSSHNEVDIAAIQDESWRFPETLKTAQAAQSSGGKSEVEQAPEIEDIFEQAKKKGLATDKLIETQTDAPGIEEAKKGVVQDREMETQTDDQQLPEKTRFLEAEIEAEETLSTELGFKYPQLHTCVGHCEELKIKGLSVAGKDVCDCDTQKAAVRVNASMVFTANPSRNVMERHHQDSSNFPSSFKSNNSAGSLRSSAIAAESSITDRDLSGQCQSPDMPQNLKKLQYSRSGGASALASEDQKSNHFQKLCSGLKALATTKQFEHSLMSQGERDITVNLELRTRIPAGEFTIAEPDVSRSLAATYLDSGVELVGTPYSRAAKGKSGDGEAKQSLYLSKRIQTKKVVHKQPNQECALAARLAAKIKQALEGLDEKMLNRTTSSSMLASNPSLIGRSRGHHELDDHSGSDRVAVERTSQKMSHSLLSKTTECPSEYHCPTSSIDHDSQEIVGARSGGKDLPSGCAKGYKDLKDISQHLRNGDFKTGLSTTWSKSDLQDSDHHLRNENVKANQSKNHSMGDSNDANQQLRNQDFKAESAKTQLHIDTDSAKDIVHLTNNLTVEEQKIQMLSSVREIRSVAETAKRLFTDLVLCVNQQIQTNQTKEQDRCVTVQIENSNTDAQQVQNVPSEGKVHNLASVSCSEIAPVGGATNEAMSIGTEVPIPNKNATKYKPTTPKSLKKKITPSHYTLEKNTARNLAHAAELLSRGIHGASRMEGAAQSSNFPVDGIPVEFPHKTSQYSIISQTSHTDQPGISIEIIPGRESPQHEWDEVGHEKVPEVDQHPSRSIATQRARQSSAIRPITARGSGLPSTAISHRVAQCENQMGAHHETLQEQSHKLRRPRHMPQVSSVDQTAAAQGLAKEIEVMTTKGAFKANLRSTAIEHAPLANPVYEEHKEPHRHTYLDRAFLAAAQAVKFRLDPQISLNGGNQQQPTLQKRQTSRPKDVIKESGRGEFYNQMHQELGELARERIKLQWQERAHFQAIEQCLHHMPCTQSPVLLSQQSRTVFGLQNVLKKDVSSSNQFTLQSNEEDPHFLLRDMGPDISSQIALGTFADYLARGAKRQRSAGSPGKESGKKLLRSSAGKRLSQYFSSRKQPPSIVSASLLREKAVGNASKLGKCLAMDDATMKNAVAVERRGQQIIKHEHVQHISQAKEYAFMRRFKPHNLAQRKTSVRRKGESPALVDQMTQVKPVLEDHCVKASARRRNVRPPGYLFKAGVSLMQMSDRITGGKLRSTLDKTTKPTRLATTVQDTCTKLDKSKIVRYARPGNVRGMTLTSFEKLMESKRNGSLRQRSTLPEEGWRWNRQCKGWNSDPCITSDTPHRPADIARHNRSSLKKIQTPKRIHCSLCLPKDKEKQLSLQHVTFALRERIMQERQQRRLKRPWNAKNATVVKQKGTRSTGSHTRSTEMELWPRAETQQAEVKERQAAEVFAQDRSVSKEELETQGKFVFQDNSWAKILKAEIDKVVQGKSLHNLATAKCTSEEESPVWKKNYLNWEDLDGANCNELEGEEDDLQCDSDGLMHSIHEEDDTSQTQGHYELADRTDSGGSAVKIGSGDTIKQEADVAYEGPTAPQPEGALVSASPCPSNDMEGSILVEPNEAEEFIQQMIAKDTCETVSQLCQDSTILDKMSEFPQKLARTCCTSDQDLKRDHGQMGTDEDVINNIPMATEDVVSNSLSVKNIDRDDSCPDFNMLKYTKLKDTGPTPWRIPEYTLDHSLSKDKEQICIKDVLMDIVLHTILQDDPLQDVPPHLHTIDMLQGSDNRVQHQMQTNKVVQGVTQLPPDVQQAAGGNLVSTFPATTGPPRAEKECQTMELKMPAQPLEQHSLKLQGSPSEVYNQKEQQTVNHQWSCTSAETPEEDSRTTGSPFGSTPLPMLVPVYLTCSGCMVMPSIQFPGSSPPAQHTLQPVSGCKHNQGTQLAHPHISSYQNNNASLLVRAPKLHGSGGRPGKRCASWEEKNSERGSQECTSPITPPTPLSSPTYKANLKKAMEPFAAFSPAERFTLPEAASDKADPPTACTSEGFQIEVDRFQQTLPAQVLEPEIEPAQGVSKTLSLQQSCAAEVGQDVESHRVGSFGAIRAEIKELEEAALLLLKKTCMMTPSATSLSGDSSCASSPILSNLSPGELKTEGARQSSISGDEGCTNEMHLFVTRGDSSQRYHQRALTLEPFGIRKLLHCLGPPSEGEVEAGALQLMDEAGQVHNGVIPSCSRTIDHDGVTEPGELPAAQDDSNFHMMPVHQTAPIPDQQASLASSMSEGEFKANTTGAFEIQFVT